MTRVDRLERGVLGLEPHAVALAEEALHRRLVGCLVVAGERDDDVAVPRRLLAVHEAADEQVLHPLTRLYVHGGDHIVADLLAEEHHTGQTLAALEDMGIDAPEFPRLLSELRATVLEHANREEAYEFRYLRRDVPASELRAFSAALSTAEAVTPTRPTPAAGKD